MHDHDTSTRRAFLRTLAVGGASLGIASLAIGCDDGGGGDPDAGGGGDPDAAGGSCESVSTSIASNHGHELSVPVADVEAGAEKVYDIQGTSSHAHQVTVTAADFTDIAMGGSVMITSTTGSGHTHEVTVTCA